MSGRDLIENTFVYCHYVIIMLSCLRIYTRVLLVIFMFLIWAYKKHEHLPHVSFMVAR